MRFRLVPPSPKPLLSKAQRGLSRVVWGRWLLGFLFWESTGDRRWCPWKTFSETVWDVEKYHPGTRKEVLTFALALADHMMYRTELEGSWDWAQANVDDFETWLLARGGQ